MLSFWEEKVYARVSLREGKYEEAPNFTDSAR